MRRTLTVLFTSALVLGASACSDDDSASDLSTADPASDATLDSTQPETQPAAGLAATETALEFLDARNARDGRAMRALVADDADVTDFAVNEPDDYLAMADLERTLQWQYLDPECTATLIGPEARVGCTYVVQNRLSRATGTGPYSGSRIDFEISDGLIHMVANTFDHSTYGSEVLVPFTEWLNAEHPGDVDVMFFTNESGEVNRSLSPESLALWEERVSEYVALEDAG